MTCLCILRCGENTSHLDKFLHEIKLSGLTLNLKKCNFAVGEVKFVGHIIGSGQRRADPDKISAMQYMTTPVDKKQVRQILGFFSFFRATFSTLLTWQNR